MARDTSPTDRRGYQRPGLGDDWAAAWDELVEDSDALAVERGPVADRPSTGAYDDALYHAVDQRTLWRWDATKSDWVAQAGLGTADSPVPGTAHFEAVSTDDSVTVTTGEATNTLHYGSNQDRANAGDNSVALGIGARANGDDGAGGSINSHVAVGYEAGVSNTGNNVTATGYRAARDNTGDRVTAAGYRAAQNNTGFGVTAAGYEAAQNNTESDVTAAGYRAAQDNTGSNVTAAGYLAAQDNTGFGVIATGYQAAQNNTGFAVTAVGYLAARGDGLSDPTTMGNANIGIGGSAIRNNQASGLIAIGQDAGKNAQTDDQLIITQRDGTRRMVMDLTTGDLQITGSLTENATL